MEQVAAALVSVGIEEEEIIPAAVGGPLVAGKVLSIDTTRQSNGKDINYCRVDVGEYNDAPGTGAEPSDLPSRGIICGAHNFTVGDTVVVALPGAVLPGPFPIGARKTYGHVSDGMICSLRELGLGEDHDGIIVLNQTLPASDLPAPGEDMIPRLDLGEEVLEVNVTPDRGYCFSMRGLAREYSHATGARFTDPVDSATLISLAKTRDEGGFAVEVDADAARDGRPAADRFVTRIVRGIDAAAATPDWMRRRLEQAGMRSLGLIVDVTNYVMLDLGQPLHAYNLDAVTPPFVVRRAKPGEKFTTLDEVERTLDEGDLLIADSPDGAGSRVVGIAGVMGGLDSEVRSETADVVIEAAHFDPVSVARTARRHRLSSESSKRFERGVDPQLAPIAAARAADLLAQFGGGTIDPSGIDLNQVAPPTPIRMRGNEPARLTGVDYTPEQITGYLEAIGCSVTFDEAALDGSGVFVVVPPSWRPDLVGPAHLVEEIARLDGYDKVPARVAMGTGSGGLTAEQTLRRWTAQQLAAAGLVEVKSYPFVGSAHDRQGIPDGDLRRDAVRLRNPLADDSPLLRTSILDTLLEVAERNTSRGVTPLALFELGQIAMPGQTVPAAIPSSHSRPTDSELEALLRGVPRQPWRAAGVMAGTFSPESGAELIDSVPAPINWGWSDAIEAARRITESEGLRLEVTRTWVPEGTRTLRGAPVPAPVSGPEQTAPFHPGRCATLFVRSGKGFKVVGYAGELHPRVIDEYGLPPRAAAFEVFLDVVGSLVKPGFLQVKPVSTYPLVKEDVSVVVEDYIPESDVVSVIRRATGPLLESVRLFDIYRGEQIPEGSRSLAYSFTLRGANETLDTEQVAQVRARVIQDLQKRLGATVRTQ